MKVLINISEQKYKWICENPLVYDSDLEISVRKGIAIPENATNGDVIKTMFPNIEIDEICDELIAVYKLDVMGTLFYRIWWDAPYKELNNEK